MDNSIIKVILHQFIHFISFVFTIKEKIKKFHLNYFFVMKQNHKKHKIIGSEYISHMNDKLRFHTLRHKEMTNERNE